MIKELVTEVVKGTVKSQLKPITNIAKAVEDASKASSGLEAAKIIGKAASPGTADTIKTLNKLRRTSNFGEAAKLIAKSRGIKIPSSVQGWIQYTLPTGLRQGWDVEDILRKKLLGAHISSDMADDIVEDLLGHSEHKQKRLDEERYREERREAREEAARQKQLSIEQRRQEIIQAREEAERQKRERHEQRVAQQVESAKQAAGEADTVTKLNNVVKRMDALIEKYTLKKDFQAADDMRAAREDVVQKIQRLNEQQNLLNQLTSSQELVRTDIQTGTSTLAPEKELAMEIFGFDPDQETGNKKYAAHYVNVFKQNVGLSRKYELETMDDVTDAHNLAELRRDAFKNRSKMPGRLTDTERDMIEVENIRSAIASGKGAFTGEAGQLINNMTDDELLTFVKWANHSQDPLAFQAKELLSSGFMYKNIDADEITVTMQLNAAGQPAENDDTKLYYIIVNFMNNRTKISDQRLFEMLGPELTEDLFMNRTETGGMIHSIQWSTLYYNLGVSPKPGWSNVYNRLRGRYRKPLTQNTAFNEYLRNRE